MYVQGFTSTRLGLVCDLPEDAPMKPLQQKRKSAFENIIGRGENGVFSHFPTRAAYCRKIRPSYPSCKAGACTGQNSSLKNNKGQ